MPRPTKSSDALTGHKTKLEIEQRKTAEENLKTGIPIFEFSETRKNKNAHKEYRRVFKLFEELNKNDGLYTAVINRYCMLRAECVEFETLKLEYKNAIEEISQDKEKIVDVYLTDGSKDSITLAQYYRMKNNFSKTILSLDSAIMTKRKMLFDIERENLMTVASSLRSISKSPNKPQESAIIKALQDDED